MKQRHTEAYRTNSRAILASLRIAIGQDFHTLSSSQVDGLLAVADEHRYRKPHNANGSRARYFHELLQRRAR